MGAKEKTNKIRILKVVLVGISIVLVLVFAPRLGAPRVIDSVMFTPKSGSKGLTNLGWLLLITVPICVNLIINVVLKLLTSKNSKD